MIQGSRGIAVVHGIGLVEKREGAVRILKRRSKPSSTAEACAKSLPFK